MDNRGFALPAVFVTLILLALVASAAAVMTRTEYRVAGLFNFSNRASAAATAGLEHAMTHFFVNGADDGWPVEGEVGGYDYTVSIERDRFDFGDGEVDVSWSTASSYNGSGDGGEVWVLTSTATRDPYRAVQRMRITSEPFDLRVNSALQANSNVTLRGHTTIDGRNTDMITGLPEEPQNNGLTGACEENKPAVVLTDLDDEVDKMGSGTLNGNSNYAGNSPPYTLVDETFVPNTPEEVLGLPPSALDPFAQTADQFYTNQADSIARIVYTIDAFGTKAGGGAGGQVDGTGILIVHNPLYDPREWDPDDPLYSSSDATAHRADPDTYGPATLGNINGGVFRGLIIADEINSIDGNIIVYGAVVSLSRTNEAIIGAGTLNLKYSCDALIAIANGAQATRRLAWVAE